MTQCIECIFLTLLSKKFLIVLAWYWLRRLKTTWTISLNVVWPLLLKAGQTDNWTFFSNTFSRPITKLTSLEELHLSHMSRLQNVAAGSFGGLVKLDILRLNHNPRLTYLDPEFLVYRDDDQVPYWPTLREVSFSKSSNDVIMCLYVWL